MSATDKTASFMIRFTQKIYKDDEGDHQIQWRGKVSHVQSGENVGFVEFDRAVEFMQDHLGDVTNKSVENETKEDKETILDKSLDIFNKFRKSAPKLVLDTIKDPMGQVENIQDQIKEQIRDVSGEISQKLDIDKVLAASKNDYKEIMSAMTKMSAQIEALTAKVESLEK